jgi:hypothetical protein
MAESDGSALMRINAERRECSSLSVRMDGAMTDSTTMLYLTAAIARAESHMARLRRNMAGMPAKESKNALELMELQKRRLERHRLAIAARARGTLQ